MFVTDHPSRTREIDNRKLRTQNVFCTYKFYARNKLKKNNISTANYTQWYGGKHRVRGTLFTSGENNTIINCCRRKPVAEDVRVICFRYIRTQCALFFPFDFRKKK